MDFTEKVYNKMKERNFFIKGEVNFYLIGKFQRFPNANTYSRKKDLFVVVNEKSVTFGDWHYPDDWFTVWDGDYKKQTSQELIERRIELVKTKANQRIEKHKKEYRAQMFWDRFYVSKNIEHDYVRKKQIFPVFCRQYRSWLLVPIADINHELKTLQIIKPNGFKRLWKGTSYKNLMIWLSPKLNDQYSGTIRICEGYATGATIFNLTSSPVVCAINAQNVVAVAIQIRRKFIHAKIKICADNDMFNEKNTGLFYANQACLLTGSELYYPIFDDKFLQLKPTDFNDMLVMCGEKLTKEQLKIKRPLV